MKRKEAVVFLSGFIFLLALNLVQAGLTELLDDEAYYWMYSQHLAWGYYDHPPMVALMVAAGYHLMHNNLGVRLVPAIAVASSIWFVYTLQKPFKPSRLIIIILSLGIIQFGGFLAVPDAPLIFFSAMYLRVFYTFLRKSTWLNAIFLGACMAALLYSKYQGLLFIAFSVLANIRLLGTSLFWIAVMTCLLMMVPHLYWQYEHGFPPLQYFIVDRNAESSYHLNGTTDYLLGQLFLFGPLIGWMIFLAAYAGKALGDDWIRTLKMIVWGITGFFLLATFKVHVETNWTTVAIIPGILLLHHYLDESPKMEKLLLRILPFSLLIIFFIRAAMVRDFLGDKVSINVELHENRVWTSRIKAKARGYPVYFVNSYQEASKYIYYQHCPATSYNGVTYRNNQYDFWREDSNWLQDSILLVSTDRNHVSADSIESSQGRLYCKMYPNPNKSLDYSFEKQLPPRKNLVRFFE